MTVRLRPHHLLCLLTYAGNGYGPAFTANCNAIAARVARGESILIVEGPDDICAPLLDDPDPHCHRDSVTERDRLAASDVGVLLATPIGAGENLVLGPDVLRLQREAFASGRTRAACLGCQWSDLCSSIAANDYSETIVALRSVDRTRQPVSHCRVGQRLRE